MPRTTAFGSPLSSASQNATMATVTRKVSVMSKMTSRASTRARGHAAKTSPARSPAASPNMRRARNHTSSMVATPISADGKRAALFGNAKGFQRCRLHPEIDGRLVKVNKAVVVRRNPIPRGQHLAPHFGVAALVGFKQGKPSQTREEQHRRREKQQAQRKGESFRGVGVGFRGRQGYRVIRGSAMGDRSLGWSP